MLWTKKGNVMDEIQSRSYVAGDPSTQSGASKLIETIKQYWKDKGKEVKLWVEPFVAANVATYNMFQIRSNLRNGLPK